MKSGPGRYRRVACAVDRRVEPRSDAVARGSRPHGIMVARTDERGHMSDLIEAILDRHTVRTYSGEEVLETQTEKIIAAGQSTPCENPLHISVIETTSVLDNISDAIIDAAAEGLAAGMDPGDDPLFGAPMLILVSADPSSRRCHDDSVAASVTMGITASALGLGSCPVDSALLAFRGDSAADLRRAAGIPSGFEVEAALVVGVASGPMEGAPQQSHIVTRVR